MEASRLVRCGPRRMLRPPLPYVNWRGVAQAPPVVLNDVSNQCVIVGSDSSPDVRRFGTARSRVRYRRGQHGRERQPALQRKNPVDLPAAEDRVRERIRKADAPAFSERQVVNQALGRAVPDVKAAASPIEEAVSDVLRNWTFRAAALLRGNVIDRMRPGIGAQPREAPWQSAAPL